MAGPVSGITDIIEAAEERGWVCTFADGRAGSYVLEEPLAAGVTLRVSGRGLTPDFVRTLPIARMPEARPAVTADPHTWTQIRPGVSVRDVSGVSMHIEDDGDPS